MKLDGETNIQQENRLLKQRIKEQKVIPKTTQTNNNTPLTLLLEAI